MRGAIEKMAYFSNRLMKSSARNDVNKQNLLRDAKTTLSGLLSNLSSRDLCGAANRFCYAYLCLPGTLCIFTLFRSSSGLNLLRRTKSQKICADLPHLLSYLLLRSCQHGMFDGIGAKPFVGWNAQFQRFGAGDVCVCRQARARPHVPKPMGRGRKAVVARGKTGQTRKE